MADELGPAIVALQGKLDQQLRSVADTKRTINMLLKMSGQQEMYPEDSSEQSGVVRPDQFYGKGLATSSAEYLAMRRQACTADDILRALIAGGFDFDLQGWKEEDRSRSLAMSLAKNTGATGKFHRLKNGTFGLRAWYDEDFLRKAAAASEAPTKAKKSRNAKAKSKHHTAASAKHSKATKSTQSSESGSSEDDSEDEEASSE